MNIWRKATIVKFRLLLPALTLAVAANRLRAQQVLGAGFTYQGQLQNNGVLVDKQLVDLQFSLYQDPGGSNLIGGPVSVSQVGVTNGLFVATVDFGQSPFTGNASWLGIAARFSGGGSFQALTPLQELTPAPNAVFASSATALLGRLPASQLGGTVANAQLASNSITITAGAGLGGGGKVQLGGTTTLNNAGVTSLAASGGLTVSASSGAVTLGTTATTTAATNALVLRDASGSFSAHSVTLGGALNLPFPAVVTADGSPLIMEGGSLYVGVNGADPSVDRNTAVLFNAAFGDYALAAEAATNEPVGAYNTAIGNYALMKNTSGSRNTAVGEEALILNTVGYANTAVGSGALYDNTNGSYNMAAGFQALYYDTSGSNNVAIGAYALFLNTNGAYNTAIGTEALYGNTEGAYNTAAGFEALASNTAGSESAALGFQALDSNTSGGDNTAIGFAALWSNDSGSYNTAGGAGALLANTSGSNNTAFGYQALFNAATSDDNNIALGYMAGYNLTGGVQNIYIGNQGGGGDNATIRLGTQGAQTNTFIAGIYGVTVANGAQVYVNSAGQLGVLPAAQGTAGNEERLALATIEKLVANLAVQIQEQAVRMKEKDAAIRDLKERLDSLERLVSNPARTR